MEFEEAASFLSSLKHMRPKLGTETTAELLEVVNDPHEGISFVQIAGSNGKGSTARMVECVLREAGLDVGLYTSPDLDGFRERIRVNGRWMPERSVCEFVEAIEPRVRDRTIEGDPPTFFEVLTVMALQHFGDEDVDVAVLEVGIGGRYDATSVVDPVSAAVTSVSLEHTDILGETVEEIAHDKAQVAPEGKPLVTGVTGDALDAIRDETEVVTVGYDAADILVATDGLTDEDEMAISIDDPELSIETSIPLLGDHQAVNAGVAVTVARQVTDVNERAIARGLRKATWPGRFEIMSDTPLVILDGAHNPAACETLSQVLGWFDFDDLHLVFGAMGDKDHRGMRKALPTPDTVTVCRPDTNRAAECNLLETVFAGEANGKITSGGSVQGAVESALDRADSADCVVITGSLFVVAEARDRWTKAPIEKRGDPDTGNRLHGRSDATHGSCLSGHTPPVHRTIELRVRNAQARKLQRLMLSAGGHATVSGQPDSTGPRELLLAGTIAQFERLLECAEETRELSPLTSQLRRVLGSHNATDTGRRYPWTDGTAIMGILNVTPDSFHDGGEFVDPVDAVRHARRMVADGADIVDVGGESTRPGADPVPTDRERERVVPVVRELEALDALVSVDTRRATVARAALEAGADMINDVSGLQDPAMCYVAAEYDVPLVIMHSIDAPVDPDQSVTYDDVVEDVRTELTERVLLAERAGLDREQIVVDPGLGFGKRPVESFELLDRIGEFSGLRCPVLVGHSHKSMFERMGSGPEDRLAPTIAATALAAERDVDIVRVHDVEENAAAIRTVDAVGRR